MKRDPRPRAIDFVVPDLFGCAGGIARIARAMALALAQWAEAHDVPLVVHALRDEAGRRDDRYLPEPHAYHPYAGARAALARAVLARAYAQPGAARAVIFAHPNLAALSLGFGPWVRCAVVAHGIDVWTRLRVERRAALRRAQALWPVSRDTARHVLAQGVAPERVRVLANALDPFWPLPAAPARGAAHVLCVSRLEPDHLYKGVDLTLAALAHMPPAERPRLVVAGDGADRPRLEAIARHLELDARFTGRVSDAALVGLSREARAFVLPSTGEGFGLVYLEAMAFALPCIAARAGGAPEVVAHEETGLLIEPGDVAGLATALGRVLGPEGEAWGRAGRAALEREFTFDAYRTRVHAALEALLARQGAVVEQP